MPFSKEPFRDPSEPLFEARINELEKGEGVGEITTAKLPAEVVTGAKVVPALLGPKLIYEDSVVINEKEAVGITTAGYFLNHEKSKPVKATASLAKYGVETASYFFWNAAEFKITGRTTKWLINVGLFTGKAPVSSFVFGVYKAAALGETTKQQEITWGAEPETGTSVTFTTPAAKSAFNKAATAAAPATETLYAFGFTNSAETAAESMVTARCQLFVVYS